MDRLSLVNKVAGTFQCMVEISKGRRILKYPEDSLSVEHPEHSTASPLPCSAAQAVTAVVDLSDDDLSEPTANTPSASVPSPSLLDNPSPRNPQTLASVASSNATRLTVTVVSGWSFPRPSIRFIRRCGDPGKHRKTPRLSASGHSRLLQRTAELEQALEHLRKTDQRLKDRVKLGERELKSVQESYETELGRLREIHEHHKMEVQRLGDLENERVIRMGKASSLVKALESELSRKDEESDAMVREIESLRAQMQELCTELSQRSREPICSATDLQSSPEKIEGEEDLDATPRASMYNKAGSVPKEGKIMSDCRAVHKEV
ncbi:hypothetical protein OE88DRAFT_1669582 [Heliocybe sulcata]|uniref:Uncharacterized protein n=1 Tax=Heliocybe sulcata TaxID=5364 RepID=A0A5C3MUW5_9AGAM|nr:hypothetical protein OE88DRAFT_1669582 [Heliocybe sulcata]